MAGEKGGRKRNPAAPPRQPFHIRETPRAIVSITASKKTSAVHLLTSSAFLWKLSFPYPFPPEQCRFCTGPIRRGHVPDTSFGHAPFSMHEPHERPTCSPHATSAHLW